MAEKTRESRNTKENPFKLSRKLSAGFENFMERFAHKDASLPSNEVTDSNVKLIYWFIVLLLCD
jgi:hypothetical protein